MSKAKEIKEEVSAEEVISEETTKEEKSKKGKKKDLKKAKKDKLEKKAAKKNKKKADSEEDENILPQNIFQVGEHVEENKNIYISQKTYKSIHKFTKNKTTNESGGILVGNIVEEFNKTNIIISGFVEAKYCEATPTALTFTHETWEYIHSEIEKKYPGKKIVGWIHTHPDFGIFLSEYDKFIQENFFSEDYQVAYVVDPIQKIEGFYFWINRNIEKCKGFFIFDKTGVSITTTPDADFEDEPTRESNFSFRNILLYVMTVIVLIQLVAIVSMNSEIESLRKSQEKTTQEIINYVNDTLYYGGMSPYTFITPDASVPDESITEPDVYIIDEGQVSGEVEAQAPTDSQSTTVQQSPTNNETSDVSVSTPVPETQSQSETGSESTQSAPVAESAPNSSEGAE